MVVMTVVGEHASTPSVLMFGGTPATSWLRIALWLVRAIGQDDPNKCRGVLLLEVIARLPPLLRGRLVSSLSYSRHTNNVTINVIMIIETYS